MNLKGIVSVSGKPGLFKIIGQNKTGFILESLDSLKNKLIVNLNTAKLASLEDITVFGDSDDLKLSDILENMKNSESVPDAKADGKTLRNHFREVAPEHDEERVYASDMKKIINWFNILKDTPFFNEVPGQTEEEFTEPVAQQNIETEKPVKQSTKEKKAE